MLNNENHYQYTREGKTITLIIGSDISRLHRIENVHILGLNHYMSLSYSNVQLYLKIINLN